MKISLSYLSHITYYQILALLKYLLPNLQVFIYTAPKDILSDYLIFPPSVSLDGSTLPNNGTQTSQYIFSCFLVSPLWKQQFYQSKTSKEAFKKIYTSKGERKNL